MVNPHHIKYAGISSNELNQNLIMCLALDGDNGETNTYLNRSAVQSESYDGRYKPIVRYKYDEVFAPKFTFLKKDLSDFSMDEVRVVLKYLTKKDTTALLEVYYDDSDMVSWAAIGGWTEINLQKLSNHRTIGVTAVFSSVYPYALSDLHTEIISESTNYKSIINVDTDDNKPVLPRIAVQEKGSVVTLLSDIRFNNSVEMADYIENTAYYNSYNQTYYWKAPKSILISRNTLPPANEGYVDWKVVEVDRAYTENDVYEDKTFYHYVDGGMYYWMSAYNFNHSVGVNNNPNLNTTSVRITNRHSSGSSVSILKNNTTTEHIMLDGANKIVSSSNTRRIFADDFNWNWLELYDGENEITVEGNCEVTLQWREVRKVGEY